MKIGILGGGQLARMLILAGTPLGLEFSVLEPAEDACARGLSRHIRAAYNDPDGLRQLAEAADCITYEFESGPADAVEQLARKRPVYPPPQALAVARDRWREKNLFQELGVETAPFRRVDSLDDLQQAVTALGAPAILKTRTLGYDGKGQVVLEADTDLAWAWRQLGQAPSILEGFVAFEREVSIIAARSRSGEIVFYPLSLNHHQGGILRTSRCLHDDPVQKLAEDYAHRVLDSLNYVGVLAIEFFQVGEHLLANEMAPRVHNSGHWTIEGAETSQFENHLRAILGWPLGSAAAVGHTAMLNLIGTMPDRQEVLAMQQAHWHDYAKAPRSGRKLGHVTLRTASPTELDASFEQLNQILAKA